MPFDSKPKNRQFLHRTSSPDARLPHSLEAEKAVLGSVLLDNNCLPIALDILKPADFMSIGNSVIWDHMVSMSNSFYAIDIVTLAEELTKSGKLEKAGGVGYIAGLSDGIPSGDDSFIRSYCQIVKDKSILRQIIKTSSNIMSRAFEASETSQDIIEYATRELNGLSESQAGLGLIKIGEVARSLGFQDLIQGEGKEGLQTGFYEIDALTHGLHRQELTLIAARPSIGKSALAANIAINMAKEGKRVALFSLEMSKESLLIRIICSEAKVDYHRIRSGWCTQEEMAKVSRAVGLVSDLPLWIDDTASLSVSKLRARAWRLRQEFGLDLLIPDYLQLLTIEHEGGRRRMDRAEEVGMIGRELKNIAKEFQIPVLALAQLNREPEKGKKRREPQLTDLRESGSLEQEADNVWFLTKDDEPAENTDVGIKVAAICRKQRNGPQGRGTLLYLAPYTRFENYSGLDSGSKPVEV